MHTELRTAALNIQSQAQLAFLIIMAFIWSPVEKAFILSD